MKRILLYIAVMLIACVGLAGCDSRTVDARLLQVNDLANTGKADSAIVLLQTIEKTTLNEYNSRYYDLMAIKSRDRAYCDISGDTAIVGIMDYFEAKGPDEMRGEAFYYGGRVFREMGDAPQALDYFQKAQDAFPQDHAFMKGEIASQMGQIFMELYMFEQAKSKFHEAVIFKKKCHDIIGVILNLRILGDVYQELDISDSALYCYKQALDLNNKSELNLQREIDIRSSIVDLYVYQKDYNKAQQEYVLFDSISTDIKQDDVYYTKINFNIFNKQYDKAQELAQELTKSQSVASRLFAFSTLANYAKYTGNETKAYDYIMESYKCQNELNKNVSRNAVIHQNSLYNYALREKENISLKNKQGYFKNTVLICVILIVVTTLISLWSYNRNRSLKRQLTLQLSKIARLEYKDELNIPATDEKKSVSELKNDIKESLLSLTRNVDFSNYCVSESVLSSSIYEKLKEALKNDRFAISESDWVELDRIINISYPEFKTNLYNLYGNISAHEYRICLLIKCKMGSTEIGKLTFRDKTSIASTRKRLYKKIFCEDGSAKDLDLFIYSL